MRTRTLSLIMCFGAVLFISVSCKKSNGSSGSGSDSTSNTNGDVSTLAGSAEGYVDGVGTAAQFSGPIGLAVDANGNVYVADYGNNCIRKITPGGTVTTFAGSSQSGKEDGTGANAHFTQPRNVAVDASNNLFVIDYNNEDIRKITPDAVVSTFAGNGYAGYTDATGTAAQFASPSGIAVDASGNVYISDLANQRIRKITPAAVVTTLAGSNGYGLTDGPGASAQFHFPKGIAVDASGNLYIADSQNYAVRKVKPDGTVSTIAGNGQQGYVDGPGTSAEFAEPVDVAIDKDGNLYVADQQNYCIRKITPSGTVSTLTGKTYSGLVNGSLADAQFDAPSGIAIDPTGKIIYVADVGNNTIRKIQLH